MPNYLRTKLSLELESKQKERWEAAGTEGAVSADKIKNFNLILSRSLERVNELREEVEERRTRTELVQSTLGETRKLVAGYLQGVGLPTLTMNRKAQLSGGRMQIPSRNVAMRAAVRSDQRQLAATPYQTSSPHKQLR